MKIKPVFNRNLPQFGNIYGPSERNTIQYTVLYTDGVPIKREICLKQIFWGSLGISPQQV